MPDELKWTPTLRRKGCPAPTWATDPSCDSLPGPPNLHPSFFGDPAMGQDLSSFFFPCCLLSNLASWAGSVRVVLALACRGRWWPAGQRSGGGGGGGGGAGWGKGGRQWGIWAC